MGKMAEVRFSAPKLALIFVTTALDPALAHEDEHRCAAIASSVIGWTFDGFPIYGDNSPDGTSITERDLDICNGQPDDRFGYRYHTSTEAPYIVQCLMGEVADFRDLPRVAPLASASGWWGGKEAGKPPVHAGDRKMA